MIDLTVLTCSCPKDRQLNNGFCTRCQNTKLIFWVSGNSFPYTPDGENRAKKFAEQVRE